nr:upf0655 protein [Quercus suber]
MSVRRLPTAVHLVLDWDGTLTVDDTMNSLSRIAQQRQSRMVMGSHGTVKLANNGSAENLSAVTQNVDTGLQSTSAGSPRQEDSMVSESRYEVLGPIDDEYQSTTRRTAAESSRDKEKTESPCYTPTTETYECKTTWEEISDAYMQDYMVHKEAHYPHQPVDDQSYRRYLASFRDIESESRQRVAKSRFFEGVKAEDITRNAQENLRSGAVRLRKGWVELFEMFLANLATGSQLSILSVNWSTTYIRQLLRLSVQHDYPAQADESRLNQLLNFVDELEITANDLDGLDSPQGSSGRIDGNVSTSSDKLGRMPPSRHCHVAQSTADHGLQPCKLTSSQCKQAPFVVYVGDSRTDYECLKAADVGLWLCDDDHARALGKFKQTFAPLETPALLSAKDIGPEMYGTCWYGWVRNMLDVADYVAGIDHGSTSEANGQLQNSSANTDS